MKRRYLACGAIGMLALVVNATYSQEWKTYEDGARGFTISYPASWRLWSQQEIEAVAAGGSGPRPVFAVQAASGPSLYVVIDSAERLPPGAGAKGRERHLRSTYAHCCGKDPSALGWRRLSQRLTALAGYPALECTWQMPALQGVVLVNRHWCLAAGERAFFIGATAAKQEFDRANDDYFSRIVRSLSVAGPAMGAEALTEGPGRITFRSERDGNWEIYAMNLDGSDVRRLTNHPARDDMPRWSPDGKQIVFRSERDGRQEIYVMNADGSGQKRLTHEDAKDSEPGFAPDGGKILFSSKRGGEWDLYTMNADGRDQRRVSAEPLKGGGGRFSPDGRRIVFASMRDGDPEIYVMRADGTHVTRLTRSPGYDGSAAWSPSGKSIAFASTREGEYDIYVMEADGSNPEKVTWPGSNESGPAFVDEHTLVFFSDREEHCEIYRIDLRTKDCTRLTYSPGYDGIPDVWVERESGK